MTLPVNHSQENFESQRVSRAHYPCELSAIKLLLIVERVYTNAIDENPKKRPVTRKSASSLLENDIEVAAHKLDYKSLSRCPRVPIPSETFMSDFKGIV